MPLIERPCSARAAGARRSRFISVTSATTSRCGAATTRSSRRWPRAAPIPRICRMSRFPETVRPTPALADALTGARYVIVAVPSHGLRARDARGRAASFRAGAVLVSATKGLETDTLRADVRGHARRDAAARIRSSCCPGRASPRRSRDGCRRRSSRRRSDAARRAAGAGRVSRSVLPSVRVGRRRRRRDRARRSRTSSRSPRASSSRWVSATTRWRR